MQETACPFLGISAAILELLEDTAVVAATDSKVLLTGESGVGKEVLARHIHRHSARSQRPIVTINCAGVPETLLEAEFFGHMRGSFTGAHRDRRGLLEMANGGTVLLDEVGEMSLRMQGMLLRFLENGEIQRLGSERPQARVDVRVIAATNRDLFEQVRKKEFREDLFYRLNIVHLVIPPLRERPEDIKVLFTHYLAEIGRQHRLPIPELSEESMQVLEQHEWPGNVRELRNVAERLLLTRPGRILTPMELSHKLLQRATPPSSAATVAAPGARAAEAVADVCYRRMVEGHESFWAIVHEPFMLRDMTRDTVRALVRTGLQQTKGSYRLLAQLFNLPAEDYKRFLSFLQKHDCHMPFQKFRVATTVVTPRDLPAGLHDGVPMGARSGGLPVGSARSA